jgi:mRNA interferase RelE/StbE
MYKIVFSKSAEKDLRKVSSVYIVSIASHIKNLSDVPRPSGCKKMVGSKNTYRIRVGIYRIVYTIKDDVLTVEVVKIDNRDSVYR